MKLILSLLLLLSFNCIAQQTGYMHYLNNPFITDAKGQPKIPVQYYPPSTFIKYVWDVYDVDTKQHHNEPLWIPKERLGGYGLENVKLGTETRDWMLNNISYTLHYLGEPVLYNYYIGKTVYRVFSQAGLMNFDYVIDIVKEADSQYLYIKIPMGRVGELYSNSLDSLGRMILPTAKPDIYTHTDNRLL